MILKVNDRLYLRHDQITKVERMTDNKWIIEYISYNPYPRRQTESVDDTYGYMRGILNLIAYDISQSHDYQREKPI